jgi:hypothetical protein
MRQVVEPSAVPTEEAPEPLWRITSEHLYLLGVIAAIGLAFGLRAAHIFHTAFPLNDGGLFYAMARDLQDASFKLPEVTSYNSTSLPFTYSPLGLYVVALLDKVTPFSLMDLFRVLPLLYTTGTVAAFFLLAKRILPTRTAVIAATFAFALVPRSFVWLLMGGGVTRALGLMLALLALHEVHRTFTTFRMRYALSAALLSGATVLTHLETGWFLAFSIAIFFLAFGKERFSVTSAAVIGTGTVLVAAPWIVAVLAMHGSGPFLAANSSGGSVFSGGDITEYALTSLARVISTSEPYFPLIAVLGVVGLLSAVQRHLLVLPAWWVAIILLDVRAFPTFTTVPVALLAGMAVNDVVLPMLSRGRLSPDLLGVPQPAKGANGANGASSSNGADEGRPRGPIFVPFPGWAVIIVMAFLVVYALAGATMRKPGLGGEGEYLTSLTQGQRSVMHWIDERTPASSTFLVMPRGPWQVDRESEWFPVLSHRESVATVQGTEWAPNGAFDIAVDFFDRAWDCGYRDSQCLATWVKTTGMTFDYVYIPSNNDFQCCGTLVESLKDDPDYLTVYDGPGGTIFHLVGSLSTPNSVKPAAAGG